MAAQDAELKLKVSLDLAFFRQQLAGLGQATAGYKIPVQVQFDRRSVQNELNALGANIRRRNYYLEVKTNLEAEIKKAEQLANALNALPKGGGPQSAAGVVGKGFSQATLKGLGDDIKILYKTLGEAGLIEFNKSIENNKAKIAKELSNIGQDTIVGLLNGINSNNPKISAAAQNLGVSLLTSLKSVLKIQSPSREMFDIGDDAGKGFELGLLKALDIAEQSATRKMRGMLDRLARMALMMSGMSAADIGSQAGQFRGGRALPAPSWAETVPQRGIPANPFNRALPGAQALSALPGTKFGAAGFLPFRPSQASTMELNNILAGAIREYFKAVAAEIGKPGKVTTVAQSLLAPGRGVAGLLPAAGGTTPRNQMRFNAVSTGATLGQPEFMRAPSIPAAIGGGGTGGGGAGGGGGGRGPGGFGMGDFGRALGSVKLPGANMIRELGSEFGFATKQVLLFGQAYKALAFLQDFPKIGRAHV